MPGFSCPHCGWQAPNVPAEFSGRRVRCKQCQGVFQLPVFDAEPRQPQLIAAPPMGSVDGSSGAPAFGGHAQMPPHATPVNISVTEQRSNPVAIAAFVLGLLSLFLFWIPYIGFVLCGVGVTTAIVGFIFATRGHRGMTFSLIGGALAIVGVLLNVALMQAFKNVMNAVEENRVVDRGEVVGRVADDAKARAVEVGQVVRLGDVDFAVIAVRRGKVRVKTFSGEQASGHSAIQVEVVIRNISTNKKIDYLGAGAASFNRPVRLFDEVGNNYLRETFGLSSTAVGQVTVESIHPGDEVRDLWIFELPVQTAKTLYFTIDGSVLGAKGLIAVEIPTSSITPAPSI